MKKQILTATLTVAFSLSTMGQCVPVIPAAAIVINTNDTINGGFDDLWVCKGDTLVSNGGFHNIFLEANAHMYTGGGIDSIWVKRGASLYMNGGIHVIFYERISDVTIAGGIPTLDSCGQIVFNYSNAPSGGCVVPLQAFFQANDSSLCGSTCISFTSLSSNATSWQWYFPGASPDTSSNENPQNICYDSTGSYNVTLIATNNNNSDTLTLTDFITLYPAATLPPLTQIGDTLFSTQGYASYQWFYGSDSIAGATDYFYAATQSGNYNLTVTDSNGCEVGEGILNVVASLTSTLSKGEGVAVFPNPASDEFKVTGLKFNDVIEIYNSLGEKVYMVTRSTVTLSEVEGRAHQTQIINSSYFSRGIYLLKISSAEKFFIKKIIIEK